MQGPTREGQAAVWAAQFAPRRAQNLSGCSRSQVDIVARLRQYRPGAIRQDDTEPLILDMGFGGSKATGQLTPRYKGNM